MKVKKENSGCARERGRIKGHGTQPKLWKRIKKYSREKNKWWKLESKWRNLENKVKKKEVLMKEIVIIIKRQKHMMLV